MLIHVFPTDDILKSLDWTSPTTHPLAHSHDYKPRMFGHDKLQWLENGGFYLVGCKTGIYVKCIDIHCV